MTRGFLAFSAAILMAVLIISPAMGYTICSSENPSYSIGSEAPYQYTMGSSGIVPYTIGSEAPYQYTMGSYGIIPYTMGSEAPYQYTMGSDGIIPYTMGSEAPYQYTMGSSGIVPYTIGSEAPYQYTMGSDGIVPYTIGSEAPYQYTMGSDGIVPYTIDAGKPAAQLEPICPTAIVEEPAAEEPVVEEPVVEEPAPEVVITTVLEVDSDGDGVIDETFTREMAEGSTALDMLNETTEVTVTWDMYGALVTGIDGVMTNWTEEGNWWKFEVDGEEALVYTSNYVLQDGQTVTMTFAGLEEGTAHELADEEPAVEVPVIEEPAVEEPAVEEPVVEEPVVEEPVVEVPVVEEPVVEEPVVEEPVVEEPVVEEPVVEEPVIEEPVVEEPAVEVPAPEVVITTVLEVDSDGDGVIDETFTHEMAEGSTALDLLNETTEVAVTWDMYGALVTGIDGVMTNWTEEGNWWKFEVDGEEALVYTSNYVLQDGQTVTMTFAGLEEGTAHELADEEPTAEENYG